MNKTWSSRVVLGVFVSAAVVACVLVWFSGSGARWVLLPEAGDIIQRAAQPFSLEKPVASGWEWSHLTIERRQARFTLTGPDGQAHLWLHHPDARLESYGEKVAYRKVAFVLPAQAEPGFDVATKLARQIGESESTGQLDGLWHDVDPRGADDPRRFSRHAVHVLQNAWILLFALLGILSVRLLHDHGTSHRKEILFLGALAMGSFLIRYFFASWGPGDLQMNLYLAFSDIGQSDLKYGAAPSAFLALLFHILPASFDTVVFVNLVLGSLAPVLMVLMSRAWFGRRDVAWWAGVLLAVQPLLIRHAGVTNRQPFVLFTALVALATLAFFLSGRHRHRWIALLTSGLAVLLCVRTRPEAVFLFMPGLLLVVLAQPLRALGSRQALKHGALVGLAWLPALFSFLATNVIWPGDFPLRRITEHMSVLVSGPAWETFVFARFDMVPAGFVLLALIGCLVSVLRRKRQDA